MATAATLVHDTAALQPSLPPSERADAILRVIPMPIIVLDGRDSIIDSNSAGEHFMGLSVAVMRRHKLAELVPFGSPLLSLVNEARDRGTVVSGYSLDLTMPRTGERMADAYVNLLPEEQDHVVVVLQERTNAEKLGKQLTHRGAARSVSALAAMLAHEIKNPLSGIKGAAQLLDSAVSDEDRTLTQLICDETDRIVKLVNGMDQFSDVRPKTREPVNVHAVLEHVKRVAQSGIARHVKFTEQYDPSLPPVYGNRDELIQVFLNLIKNAAEAIGPNAIDGEIILTSAYRPGIRLRLPGAGDKVALPLEFSVRDNGSGVPPDILPHLFDPFLTTKTQGSGLGLALVAKVVGDHGGTIACESQPHRTVFRVLLPMAAARDGRASDI
ncbi:MAG: two-component system sensor histidine kinase NtrB [Beijerinckiaceae bacterium]